MQAKKREKFCCFLQLFDNQTDIFVSRKVISMLSCEDNRFFAIFAPSLTNFLHYEIIIDQQFDQFRRELSGLGHDPNRVVLHAEPY